MPNYKLHLANAKESYKSECYSIYLENDNYLTFAHLEPKSEEKFYEKFDLVDVEPCFVLVDEKDKVIGFCSVEIAVLDSWGDLNYMVLKKFQRKGFGKIMLNMVILQMKKLGCVKYLEACTYDNQNSEKLLLSVGFAKAGFYPNYRKIFKNGEYVGLNETGFYLELR
jgi:predicted acetyltransferase